jgi:deoxyguanosine kinase
MRSFFLAIEGPIGVGKTTLARLLQPRFKAELLLEAFEENPFLSSFYGDRARYAFQTQLFFLLSRYRQQQEIPSLTASKPLIGDYTFGKDALFARLNLEGDELEMYRRLYALLADHIAVPDLMIYLRADTDTLMARIAARDRPYEREMDRDYIAMVREAYERHFATRNTKGDAKGAKAPLVIDTNDLNYVRDESALAFVEEKVRRALGIGAYQQSLPQLGESVASGWSGEHLAGEAQMRNLPQRAAYQSQPWQVGLPGLGEFLAANEALGRLGALLAQQGAGRSEVQTSQMKATLQQAMAQLRELADSIGVEQSLPHDSGAS